MVVPFGAGGGSDQFARAMATAIEEVEPELTVTVENREGGSGAVGMQYFKGLSGDAQSLLAGSSTIPVPGTAFADFSLTDYTLLAKVAEDPAVVVAPASAPYDTCEGMVEAAGDSRVVAGVAGQYTLDTVGLNLIEKDAGVQIDKTTFDSGGEILSGLLGDQIDIGLLNPGEVTGQLESGDLKALCTLGEERYPFEQVADIETAQEQGIDVSVAQFRGVIAPPGITEEQQAYWTDVVSRAVETESFTDYTDSAMVVPSLATGDDMVEYVTSSEALYTEALQ
jgi:putative tricarboxylic transport membrane protein